MIPFLLVFIPVFVVAMGGLVAVQVAYLRDAQTDDETRARMRAERRILALRPLTNGRRGGGSNDLRAVFRRAGRAALSVLQSGALPAMPRPAPLHGEGIVMRCAYSPSQKHEWGDTACLWCGQAAQVQPYGGMIDLPVGITLGPHEQSACRGKVISTAEGDARCRGCGRRFKVAAILRYEEA